MADQIKTDSKAALPPDAMTMLATIMQELVKNQQAIPESLAKAIADSNAAVVEGIQKSQRPENKIAPGISAFSYPEGEVARPKPRFTRQTYFNFADVNWEQSTPEEIIAYNALTESRELSNGWKVTISRNGSTETCHVEVPSRTMDQRMGLPSLLVILRTLATGQVAESPEEVLADRDRLLAALALQASERVVSAAKVV